MIGRQDLERGIAESWMEMRKYLDFVVFSLEFFGKSGPQLALEGFESRI